MIQAIKNIELSRIYLWGFMGSGKSTIGKELAQRIDFEFMDLDNLMEKSENMKVLEIFAKKGEDYFRKLEHETLKHVIESSKNVVLSTGGGTPCYFNNADLMNGSGVSIYLRVSPKTLRKRLIDDEINPRPLVKNLQWLEIMELYKKRQTYYKSAQIIVSNDYNLAYSLQFILKELQKP